jgi:hypothetical protein
MRLHWAASGRVIGWPISSARCTCRSTPRARFAGMSASKARFRCSSYRPALLIYGRRHAPVQWSVGQREGCLGRLPFSRPLAQAVACRCEGAISPRFDAPEHSQFDTISLKPDPFHYGDPPIRDGVSILVEYAMFAKRGPPLQKKSGGVLNLPYLQRVDLSILLLRPAGGGQWIGLRQ